MRSLEKAVYLGATLGILASPLQAQDILVGGHIGGQYSEIETHPMTFIDVGLSLEAKLDGGSLRLMFSHIPTIENGHVIDYFDPEFDIMWKITNHLYATAGIALRFAREWDGADENDNNEFQTANVPMGTAGILVRSPYSNGDNSVEMDLEARMVYNQDIDTGKSVVDNNLSFQLLMRISANFSKIYKDIFNKEQ